MERLLKKKKKRLKDIQKLDENLANLNSNNLNYNTAAVSNVPHTRNFVQNQNLSLTEPYAYNVSPARAATKATKKKINNAKVGLGLVSKHKFHWITTKYF